MGEERAEGLLAEGSGARITTAHRELPLGSLFPGFRSATWSHHSS